MFHVQPACPNCKTEFQKGDVTCKKCRTKRGTLKGPKDPNHPANLTVKTKTARDWTCPVCIIDWSADVQSCERCGGARPTPSKSTGPHHSAPSTPTGDGPSDSSSSASPSSSSSSSAASAAPAGARVLSPGMRNREENRWSGSKPFSGTAISSSMSPQGGATPAFANIKLKSAASAPRATSPSASTTSAASASSSTNSSFISSTANARGAPTTTKSATVSSSTSPSASSPSSSSASATTATAATAVVAALSSKRGSADADELDFDAPEFDREVSKELAFFTLPPPPPTPPASQSDFLAAANGRDLDTLSTASAPALSSVKPTSYSNSPARPAVVLGGFDMVRVLVPRSLGGGFITIKCERDGSGALGSAGKTNSNNNSPSAEYKVMTSGMVSSTSLSSPKQLKPSASQAESNKGCTVSTVKSRVLDTINKKRSSSIRMSSAGLVALTPGNQDTTLPVDPTAFNPNLFVLSKRANGMALRDDLTVVECFAHGDNRATRALVPLKSAGEEKGAAPHTAGYYVLYLAHLKAYSSEYDDENERLHAAADDESSPSAGGAAAGGKYIFQPRSSLHQSHVLNTPAVPSSTPPPSASPTASLSGGAVGSNGGGARRWGFNSSTTASTTGHTGRLTTGGLVGALFGVNKNNKQPTSPDNKQTPAAASSNSGGSNFKSAANRSRSQPRAAGRK